MNKKEILSVSLESLLKINPPQSGDLCYKGCIIGQRSVADASLAMDLFRFPTRIDAFGTVLCSKGSITVSSDLRQCLIGPQTLFVCPPGTIVQVESRNDASVFFILCDEEFIKRVHIDLKQLLHLFIAVRENPYLTLDDREWSEMMRSVDEIFVEARRQRDDTLSTEILHSLFRMLAYRLCRIIDDRLGAEPDEQTPIKNLSQNRGAVYFNAFIEELSHHYLHDRSVAFYAAQLHLTPKYLTTLLRITTGRTASEWIDDYVVLEAKNLLKYSTMNIQEIAYYLNFPNQSFFGRYFKQHTGLTPTAYRSSK